MFQASAGIEGIAALAFLQSAASACFTGEWDRGCQKTYMANFPHDPHFHPR
jgi:site-specific DNA-cytosine methylase